MIYSQLTIKAINNEPDNLKLLRQLAIWHNETPKLWMDDYELEEDDIKDTIEQILSRKEEDIYIGIVKDSQDQVQGFIWADKYQETGNMMIKSLYVTSEYRQQGIASDLKTKLEEYCLAHGIEKIVSTVHYTNKKMLDLNMKLGYVPGMVWMSKTIKK